MGSILKALVTVELQLCSDLLFPFGSLDCIQHKINRLLSSGLICHNAIVIQIPDDRKIQYALLGVYVRNICCSLLIRSVGFEILLPKILVFVDVFRVFVVSAASDDG